MSSVPRFGSIDSILFLVVLAVALGSRAWYLGACADMAQKEGPLQVQDPPRTFPEPAIGTPRDGRTAPSELEALVTNLKDQHRFAGPAPFSRGEEITAHQAPGYALCLAGLELLPIDLGPSERTMRWIQCALGTLTAVFYFLFARQAFGNRAVAALTGLFCALHPFWIINTAEVKDGVLATFLLAAVLLLGARASQRGGPIASLLYGLLLAASALVRAALLPFALVALLWFLLRCRTLRTGWLYAFLAFLGFATGLGPWIFRDFKNFNDIIPVADSAYLHLWAGNNPLANGGPQSEAVLLKALAQTRGETPEALADQLQQLPQKRRYDSLAGDVFKSIADDPAGTFRRRMQAAGFFLFGEECFQRRTVWRTHEGEIADMPAWLATSYPAVLFGTLLGMLALGLLGWRWTYGFRAEAMPSALALVWVPLPYLLSHAEGLQGPRLPLDGILLCYAAFALVYLVPPLGATLWQGADYLNEPAPRY